MRLAGLPGVERPAGGGRLRSPPCGFGESLVWQARMLENYDFKYEGQYYDAYNRAMRNPKLLDILEQLIGSDIRHHHTKLNNKAPGGGAQVDVRAGARAVDRVPQPGLLRVERDGPRLADGRADLCRASGA